MVSALPSVPLSVGAHRVVRGVRVEHLCGDPDLPPEQDRALMLRIVRTALRAVQTPVERPTLFDPAETSEAREVVGAS
jgi:hypothetical protein